MSTRFYEVRFRTLPPSAKESTDRIMDSLDSYFALVNDHYRSPLAMFYAIELILQSKTLSEMGHFNAIRGKLEPKDVNDYCQAALTEWHRVKPSLWRLEGDALRRWSWARVSPYSLHEGFWALFLHRFVGASDSSLADPVEKLLSLPYNFDPNQNFDHLWNLGFSMREPRERIIDPSMYTTMKQVFENLNVWKR